MLDEQNKRRRENKKDVEKGRVTAFAVDEFQQKGYTSAIVCSVWQVSVECAAWRKAN